MLLIGSRALNYWFPEARVNTASDWDIVSDYKFEKKGFELHHSSEYLSDYILNHFRSGHYIDCDIGVIEVCSVEGLAAIKRSHLSLDWKWYKHMFVYNMFLSDSLPTQHLQWIKDREQLTLQNYNQRNPKLNKSVEDFFDDYVEKKYDHDWLHTLVAFKDQPMYTKMQKDNGTVWCHKDLWEQFTHEEKIYTVSEEAHVIALERFLIPSDWTVPPKLAYNKAINKVCTSLTSGWFRDFAIDNWIEVHHYFQPALMQKLKEKHL